ncbi:MAG: hypothetical protein E7031_00650 [Akkermansiaceae bacterium]|nr:hypothetical protein [Akkermansiaceae bacterium]
MNRNRNLMLLKLQRYGQKLSRNWKPKLITLGLAIIVWCLVSYSNSDNSDEWDEHDTRIVIPE